MFTTIFSRAVRSVLLEDDKASFLSKNVELVEISGTLLGSSVCTFTETVEVTVAGILSSQVSFVIFMAWITFPMSFTLLSFHLKDIPISISTSRNNMTDISLGSPALSFAILPAFLSLLPCTFWLCRYKYRQSFLNEPVIFRHKELTVIHLPVEN